jgi:hypothetical protein
MNTEIAMQKDLMPPDDLETELPKSSPRFGTIKIGRLLLIALPYLLLLVVWILAYHQVDNSVTDEDRQYLGLIFNLGGVEPLPPQADHQRLINFIVEVNKAVLAASPEAKPIAPGGPRGPRELYQSRTGGSHDRCRVMEKAFIMHGLTIRHALVYPSSPAGGNPGAAGEPTAEAYAVCEVLTPQGWLLVDADNPWLALDQDLNPFSLEAVRADLSLKGIAWHPSYSLQKPEFLRKQFAYCYGVYSSHGLFYPPYNFIPDIYWPQVGYNFFSD